jgi:hypothetical protein
MKEALDSILATANRSTSVRGMVELIRKEVYGNSGWDSEYRIDILEFDTYGVKLSVSNRSLVTVYRSTKKFDIEFKIVA